IYFYSSRELNAHVRVTFPQGLITEWYPQAKYEVDQKSGSDGSMRLLAANLRGMDTSLRNLAGAIEWRDIKVQPGIAPTFPVESGPNRYYAARATDAAPITIAGQSEKFLFYRGVGHFSVPLSARVSVDGKIAVENRSQRRVPSVIFFENHDGRIGHSTAELSTTPLRSVHQAWTARSHNCCRIWRARSSNKACFRKKPTRWSRRGR